MDAAAPGRGFALDAHVQERETLGRVSALALLAAANLMWAGNWVTGRALRDAFDPVTINFWRWAVAVAVLAPVAAAPVLRKRKLIRANLGMLLLLSLIGVAMFQTFVYQGLRTTSAINAVLMNSSAPLFIMLCSWGLERERAHGRQVAGMLISLAGILVIMTRGELGRLLQLEFHSGDAWIIAAMPLWGLYSVLLKRRPAGLDGIEFLFAISVIGLVLMLPLFIAQPSPPSPGALQVSGVIYTGLAASVGAFICWNKGVSVVGANTAGFTLHLLPAFGTVLAIVFLGESFALFHAVGIATILAGVVLATRNPVKEKT